MKRPACFADDEWESWSEAANVAAAQTRWGKPVQSPCADCPLAFALQMRAEGRCDGVPGGLGRPVVGSEAIAAWWASYG